LISHYLGIVADKSFQKADWRVRPLNKEMITYAVSDTRYLARLTYDLLSDLKSYCDSNYQNIEEVFTDIQLTCKNLTLSRYEKPKVFSNGYGKLVDQLQQRYNPLQLKILQVIWVKLLEMEKS